MIESEFELYSYSLVCFFEKFIDHSLLITFRDEFTYSYDHKYIKSYHKLPCKILHFSFSRKLLAFVMFLFLSSSMIMRYQIKSSIFKIVV